MISIEELCSSMNRINDMAKSHSGKLENCRNEILDVMNETQSIFGYDCAGQGIVFALSEAMKCLVTADSNLSLTESHINSYIAQLRK